MYSLIKDLQCFSFDFVGFFPSTTNDKIPSFVMLAND